MSLLDLARDISATAERHRRLALERFAARNVRKADNRYGFTKHTTWPEEFAYRRRVIRAGIARYRDLRRSISELERTARIVAAAEALSAHAADNGDAIGWQAAWGVVEAVRS